MWCAAKLAPPVHLFMMLIYDVGMHVCLKRNRVCAVACSSLLHAVVFVPFLLEVRSPCTRTSTDYNYLN